MLSWWRRFRPPPPLGGAPAVSRLKTYSARSGYVYQYTYQGRRPAAGATEYVFALRAGPGQLPPVSVLLEEAALQAWQQAHGRGLNATERYAAAKMALFQAFDERDRPAQMREPVRVRAADLDGLLQTLGIE